MITPKTYNRFILIMILLILIDFIMTYIFVFKYGFIEMNPFVFKAIRYGGQLGFIIYNILMGVGWYILAKIFYKQMSMFEGTKFYNLLYIGMICFIVIGLAPIGNNIYQVISWLI